MDPGGCKPVAKAQGEAKMKYRKRILGASGLLVAMMFFWASDAGAFSFQASENLEFKVPLKSLGLTEMPAAPAFLLQGLGGDFYPVTVREAAAGKDYIVCEVTEKVPLDSYALVYQTGRAMVETAETVCVLAPAVERVTVQGAQIRQGNSVTLSGMNFGNAPGVRIQCNLFDDGVTKTASVPCSLLGEASMDSTTGLSEVTVQIPSLGGALPQNAVFMVSNKFGTGSALYDAAKERAGLSQARGTLDSWRPHSTEFLKQDNVWEYLVRGIASEWLKQQAVKIFLLFSDFSKQEYHHDLYMWDIFYWTQDAFGQPVLASGVLLVPTKTTQTPFLSFQHGTMLTKNEAPTRADGAELGFAVTFAAADGFAVAMMDHQGMGEAAFDPTNVAKRRQIQPYCQGHTLAIGAADMMIASNVFLQKFYTQIKLSKLFITGYSEGAYATLALQRELETNAKDYQQLPSLVASGCGDGPYSLAKVMLEKLLADQPYPVQYFAPLSLVAMNKTYFPNSSTSTYMKFPYDVTVGEMINGYFKSDDVSRFMPDSEIPPKQILLPQVIAQIREGKGPIYQAFATNDLAGLNGDKTWKPKAQLRLYHGVNDDCVPFQNSREAYDYYHGLDIKAPITVNPNDQIWIDPTPFGITYHQVYALFVVGNIWNWFHGLVGGK
jgi:hypothetical protein